MLLDENITRLTLAGELEIDLRPAADVCLLYTSWDTGLRVYRLKGGVWHEESHWEQGIPIVTQAKNTMCAGSLKQFVTHIPLQFRVQAERFIYNQTMLLQWAARERSAGDLLLNNPVLLWMLVDKAKRSNWTEAEMRKVLVHKQIEILAQVTANSSKSAVRYLRKLVLKKGDHRELRLTLWSVERAWLIERIRSLSSIPIHVVATLYRCPELATDRMVRSLAASLSDDVGVARALSQASLIRHVWEDTVRLGRALGTANTVQVLSRCESIEHLNRLHRRWTWKYNKQRHRKNKCVVFPLPPIKGTEAIIPIRNSKELREEGRIMHHCVASYINCVLSGKSYIYKVLEPERATLELKLDNGDICMGDFRLLHDAIPSQKSFETVIEWLNSRASANERHR